MINIGVIGCGQWGMNHVRVFQGLRDCRVVAAVDQSTNRLDRVHQAYPTVECATDVGGLLSRPDVHAVIVATPAATHYAIVTEALRARKHVLCGKPLCTTAMEAQKLYELAHSSDLVLGVGHVFLYNSGIIKLKELMKTGQVGDVYYLSAVRTNLGPIRQDVNFSSDLATHDVSIFNWLLGAPPETIAATGASFVGPEVEDVIFVSLRYPGNTVASIQANHLYVIQVAGGLRQELQSHLRQRGVQTGIHYHTPLHLTPAFSFLEHKEGDFPHAEKAARKLLSLPMHPYLQTNQIECVASHISKFMRTRL